MSDWSMRQRDGIKRYLTERLGALRAFAHEHPDQVTAEITRELADLEQWILWIRGAA